MRAPSVFNKASAYLLPAGLGLTALLPFLWHYSLFGQSFWFGDEFDLLNQIRRDGFWTWCIKVFAENFIPLFKLLWGGCVYLTNGSYLGMLWIVWLTHALTAFLLARVMLQLGCGIVATVLAAVLFSLPGITIETMTWTVQSSAILAGTFFLAALNVYCGATPQNGTLPVKRSVWIIALAAASALSFSRGIVSGPIIAMLVLIPWTTAYTHWRSRLLIGGALFVVPVLAIYLIFSHSGGTHHDVVGSKVAWITPASFTLWAYAINPLCKFFLLDPNWRLVVIFAGLKLAVVIVATVVSDARTRRWLFGMAMFDVANCVLLGVGRYGTGLDLAASSRYQYIALLTIAPFVGIVFQWVLFRIRMYSSARYGLTALVILACTWQSMRVWAWWLPGWVQTRGVEGRKMLSSTPPLPETYTVPGIPFMSKEEAGEIIREFNLH